MFLLAARQRSVFTSPVLDDQWSGDFLEAARRQGDPMADATVAAIFARGDRFAVNDAFDLLLRNDRLPAAQLPTELRDFLETTSAWPDWADAELIKHAETFFLSYGLLSMASQRRLRCRNVTRWPRNPACWPSPGG